MYNNEATDNFLAHHGILGQKWGVRRFQNKDGSLKAAGKKHLDEENQNGKKSSKSKQTKTRSVSDMSNEELKSRINRAKLEKEYKELHPDTVKSGKQFADSIKKSVMEGVSAGAKTAAQKAVESMADKAIKSIMGDEDTNSNDLFKKSIHELSDTQLKKASERAELAKKVYDYKQKYGNQPMVSIVDMPDDNSNSSSSNNTNNNTNNVSKNTPANSTQIYKVGKRGRLYVNQNVK